MRLDVWAWTEGQVEDASVVVATVSNAQEAWTYLVDRGVESDEATRAAIFMDGLLYGPPVKDVHDKTYRIADSSWIAEEYKVYSP